MDVAGGLAGSLRRQMPAGFAPANQRQHEEEQHIEKERHLGAALEDVGERSAPSQRHRFEFLTDRTMHFHGMDLV